MAARTLDWRAIKNALRLYKCAIFRPMLTRSRAINRRLGYQSEPLCKDYSQHETWIVPVRGGIVLNRDGTMVHWSATRKTTDVLEAIMDTDIKRRARGSGNAS